MKTIFDLVKENKEELKRGAFEILKREEELSEELDEENDGSYFIMEMGNDQIKWKTYKNPLLICLMTLLVSYFSIKHYGLTPESI